MEKWTKTLPPTEITVEVTNETVLFAQDFSRFLAINETKPRVDKKTGKVIYKKIKKDGKEVYLLDENGERVPETDKIREKLTTSQLRKFFGEVKRIQINGFDETEFVLLKPKLAYAVSRVKKGDKDKMYYNIFDFNRIISSLIDLVLENIPNKTEKEIVQERNKRFKNFIKVFEAIVAYHKVAESGINL